MHKIDVEMAGNVVRVNQLSPYLDKTHSWVHSLTALALTDQACGEVEWGAWVQWAHELGEFMTLPRHKVPEWPFAWFGEGLWGNVEEGQVMWLLHTFPGKLGRCPLCNGAVSLYGWFFMSDEKGGKVPTDLSALFGSCSLRGGLAWSFAAGRCFVTGWTERGQRSPARLGRPHAKHRYTRSVFLFSEGEKLALRRYAWRQTLLFRVRSSYARPLILKPILN